MLVGDPPEFASINTCTPSLGMSLGTVTGLVTKRGESGEAMLSMVS